MQLLSQEAELELLTKIDEHLAKRLELAKQDNDDFDLISSKFGTQADSYAFILTKEIKQAMKFYKMPRALFESKEYQNLSIKAKTMYMLLFDRLDLSVKNGWTDEQGYTYQYYTIEQFMIDLGCSNRVVL